MAMRSPADPMKHRTVSRITATVELRTRHRLTPPNDVFFVALLFRFDVFLIWPGSGLRKSSATYEKGYARTTSTKWKAVKMAENKKSGIFINTSRRPDLLKIIEKLKAETGIVFSADLVYQALRCWFETIKK
jgi:hypothetical protein